MKIEFHIRFHTKYGQSLYILGNSDKLGTLQETNMIPMEFENNDYWKFEVELKPSDVKDGLLSYKYIFKDSEGILSSEESYDRIIDLKALSDSKTLKVYDHWNYAGNIENVFYTAPFKSILLPKAPEVKQNSKNKASHIFCIKAPLLNQGEAVCLLGEGDTLGNWNMEKPVLLQKNGDWWTVAVNLKDVNFPLAYKYGVYNTESGSFVAFESRTENRQCFESGETVILHDGFIGGVTPGWKGAGVAIPVFSLRTQNGLGVGEFADLKLLADWAKIAGMKLIQLLPVNDTMATFTWVDSYPYAAISAFALHPIYINLEKVAKKKYEDISKGLLEKQKALNELPAVDYEAVMELKISLLRELYDADGGKLLKGKDYKEFLKNNEAWLKPYAAFCYLRDKYKTVDSSKWKTNQVYEKDTIDKFFETKSPEYSEVSFHTWLQYHLHLQLLDAVQYVHEKGLIVKGDIPIGVYRYGCDAWTVPELYNMALQAGAPPDDFAVLGQNWGFPTYNWDRMQQDGFAWWRQRFEQMSHYFDAFRIDHILGFFRIWSIPLDAVQGILGRFDPCLPIYRSEFENNGIWFDRERFCNPFITEAVLSEVFGDQKEVVKEQFLQNIAWESYAMKEDFDTQRKVEDYFANLAKDEHNLWLKLGLQELIANVILFERAGSDANEFDFRISIDKTSSFRYLPQETRDRLMGLYNNYFYQRQDEFWKIESMKKLPGLKEATNMLVCGEDLGMVPGCVPDVMRDLGILSLEIQRMPKQIGVEFVNFATVPYLSVVTPSTHDMSTVRGWWQENKASTQRFYNQVLNQQGEAPVFCEPWINRAIILQHLYSPAMWSIFQVQDLLGMSESLRREMPEDERINVPANPQHYWRYRMHISLENLAKENGFNDDLKGFISDSGRD